MENIEAEVQSNLNQYVVFLLGYDEYAIDIQKVVSIERVFYTTRVPGTPEFLKGVINLRGEIIPVLDIRNRFEIQMLDETEETRVIILKIDDIVAGIISDAVVEVIGLEDTKIENLLNFSSDISSEYIFGIGNVDNRTVTILNAEKVIQLSDNI